MPDPALGLLTEGGTDEIEYPGLYVRKRTWHRSAGGGAMAATAEVLSNPAAIQLAATAETDFEETPRQLLHKDHGELGAGNRQEAIDHILRIAGQRTGLCKVLLEHVGVRQSPFQLVGHARQNDAAQSETPHGVLFVEMVEDLRRHGSRIHQGGSVPVRVTRGGTEAEPTGVGGDGCKQGRGHRRREFHIERLCGVDDQTSRSFRGGVLERFGVQLV